MLSFMILLFILSKVVSLKGKETRVPAIVFTWAILILFISSATLFATSVFFDWPKPIRKLIKGDGIEKKRSTIGDKPSNAAAISTSSSDKASGPQKGSGSVNLSKTEKPTPDNLVPSPLVPPNGAVLTNLSRSLKLSWAGPPEPSIYLLEVQAQNSQGGTWHLLTGLKPLVVRDTSFTLEFIGSQHGRWRVRRITGSGEQGKPSAWQYFYYERPRNTEGPRIPQAVGTLAKADSSISNEPPSPIFDGRLDQEEYCREEISLSLKSVSGTNISCGPDSAITSVPISNACLKWFGSDKYFIEPGSFVIRCDTSRTTPPPCSSGKSLCKGNRGYCCPSAPTQTTSGESAE
jgi:hypothetical protein